jgi:hypothetical protein
LATGDDKFCVFCEEWYPEDEVESAHIIPPARGGCDHEPNIVNACNGCNWSGRGNKGLTPLEWWAEQEWDREDENSVSAFDAGSWTLEQRHHFLLQAAYYEGRARWHMRKQHPNADMPKW